MRSSNEFRMKDLSRAKQILGRMVTRTKDAISIDQERFVKELIGKFNMMDYKPVGCEPATLKTMNLRRERERDWLKVVPFREMMRGGRSCILSMNNS